MNEHRYLDAYEGLLLHGQELSPRGQKIKEIEDAKIVLSMSVDESPCTSFRERKFNLQYAKQEFLWYLRANEYDRSIERYASTWPKIIQPDGTYFSNYGQYIFGDDSPNEFTQFEWVVDELCRDRDSRRASIVLLQREHLFAENKDVVCTYGINFRIRKNRLNMSVSMRSNDAVFGLTNDAFCFSMLYRMVHASLRFNGVDVYTGQYVHRVDSLHVYERHWDMLKRIVMDGVMGYEKVEVPQINDPDDLMWLLGRKIDANPDAVAPENLTFSRWLTT